MKCKRLRQAGGWRRVHLSVTFGGYAVAVADLVCFGIVTPYMALLRGRFEEL